MTPATESLNDNPSERSLSIDSRMKSKPFLTVAEPTKMKVKG
jgi:hypothetical protein